MSTQSSQPAGQPLQTSTTTSPPLPPPAPAPAPARTASPTTPASSQQATTNNMSIDIEKQAAIAETALPDGNNSPPPTHHPITAPLRTKPEYDRQTKDEGKAEYDGDASSDAGSSSSDSSSNLPPIQRAASRIERPKSLPREIAFVAILSCAQLMTQAGLAASVAPSHVIGSTFGSNPGQISWYAAAYSLTVGTFILIAGRLGDVFGHKPFFVAGFIWFGVWSCIAGVAVYSNQILFDFARAMQGIGPAFLLPNAIAILGRAYEPGRRQEMIFSLFGATAPCGFVLGSVFSSLLSEYAWWPWAYWILAIVCLLLGLAGHIIVPATPPTAEEAEHSSIWSRIDTLGSVTGVVALVLFNFAWNQASVVGWTVPYTYITLILGVLIFSLFIFIETRASHPLIPFGVLKIDTIFALACVGTGWSSFGIFIVYIWNFLEVIRGQSPLQTSAQCVTLAISGTCAALTTGYILSRTPASVVMLMAMSGFTIGGVLLATAPVGQTFWAQVFVGFIILTWGMDMSFPAGTILLSRAMPRKHQGLAASLVNTVINYSISLGLGFAGTVEFNVNDGGKEVLKGYRAAFYMGVGLAGLGIFVALMFCLTEWRRSRKERR